jgi:hypothetical protein
LEGKKYLNACGREKYKSNEVKTIDDSRQLWISLGFLSLIWNSNEGDQRQADGTRWQVDIET